MAQESFDRNTRIFSDLGSKAPLSDFTDSGEWTGFDIELERAFRERSEQEREAA